MLRVLIRENYRGIPPRNTRLTLTHGNNASVNFRQTSKCRRRYFSCNLVLCRAFVKSSVNSRGSIFHQTGLIITLYISFAAFKMEKVFHIKKANKSKLIKKRFAKSISILTLRVNRTILAEQIGEAGFGSFAKDVKSNSPSLFKKIATI